MGKVDLKTNTFYNILKTASSILFPLLTFPYISRVLQPENVGKINFGNSIVSYFSLLATLGVTTYAVRECAKVKGDRRRLGEVSSQIISINLITTLVSYMSLLVLLSFYKKLRDYRLLIMIQSITIICTTFGADWLNMAMEDFRYITVRTIGFQMISLILMFLFVRRPEDHIKYALITVMSASGANIINAFYRRRYCVTRFTYRCDLKDHLPPILGLFAMLMAQQVFTMCDTTIIGLTLGDHAVGLYSTAIKVYNVINQVICSILWVVMPQLSAAFAMDDVDRLKDLLRYVLQFSSLLGIPCVVAMFMLSPEIITLVGGESYVGASTSLKILSLTLLAGITSNFTFNINLLAAGRDRLCLIICSIASVVNVVANLIFIPLYGINAAAATTCIAQLLIILMSLCFIDKRLFSIDPIRISFQPLIASVGLMIVILWIRFVSDDIWVRLSVAMIFGGGIYFTVLVVLRNELVMGILDKMSGKIHR